MMKLKMDVAGRETVLLGLSFANLDRLRRDGLDGYIRVDGAELGISADIWITAAPDERTMLTAFSSGIGPHTKLHIDPKTKATS